MTAKQCECWVPNGDLLVTEAEQLMEANGLDGLDAVYKHIREHGLQYVAPPPSENPTLRLASIASNEFSSQSKLSKI